MKVSAQLIFVLFLFELIIRVFSNFSNLDRIRELRHFQDQQRKEPIETEMDEEIMLYNLCVEVWREKHPEAATKMFGPFYLFSVEGFELRPCLPKGVPINWTKLSFENEEEHVTSTDGYYSADLTLKTHSTNPQESTYYCSWKHENYSQIINNIWTVEIVGIKDLQTVEARIWKDPPIHSSGSIQLSTTWGQWSSCNKCGKTGKRHRFGYCTVTLREFVDSESEWSAMNIYSSLSCSLFILLHPEVGQINQHLTQQLAKNPKMMFGYCKVPCDYYEYNPEETFVKEIPEDLRKLYRKKEESKLGLEITDSRYNNVSISRSWLGKKLDLRLPLSVSNIPEIIFIIFLVGFQVFIVIHVCKYRIKAK